MRGGINGGGGGLSDDNKDDNDDGSKQHQEEYKQMPEATSERVHWLRSALHSTNDRKHHLEKERENARRKMGLTTKEQVGQQPMRWIC
jgi:hypothetical protein